MRERKLVQIYTSVLFGKALASKCEEKIMTEIKNICDIFCASPKARRYLSAPIYSDDEKNELLDSLLKKYKVTEIFDHFLRLLVENNRMEYLPDIMNLYEEMLNNKEGRIVAELVTAKKMSEKDLKSCISIFEKRLGKKLVISHQIDSNIIGGAILTYGNNMIDLSVLNMQNKLSREINEV